MSSKEDIYPTAFNRKMSTPEQRIAALEARIEKLEAEYDAATGDEKRAERTTIANMIIKTRKTLARLLDAQAAAIAGNAPPVTSLHSVCPLTHVLISTHSAIILYF
jgi:hypothetical protein